MTLLEEKLAWWYSSQNFEFFEKIEADLNRRIFKNWTSGPFQI
jgi:hypothetical protein